MQVHVCVDLTGPVGLVSFAVNDRWCGEAFRLPRPGTELRVFPHILVKNTAVRVTFGGDGQLEGPVGSFRPWQVTSCCEQTVSKPESGKTIRFRNISTVWLQESCNRAAMHSVQLCTINSPPSMDKHGVAAVCGQCAAALLPFAGPGSEAGPVRGAAAHRNARYRLRFHPGLYEHCQNPARLI